MKDSEYVKINSINPVYIIIDEADGYIECNSIEDKNGNKYLIFADTDKNKEVLEKYTKVWDEIKYQIEFNYIETMNAGKPIESGEYGKDFMKIKFNSDDNLPLNKILKLHNLIIVVRQLSNEL